MPLFFKVGVALALAALSNLVLSQATSPGFQLILVSDTENVAVRTVGGLVDERYVFAEAKKFHRIGGNFRDASIAVYAFDCRDGRKVALIDSRFNLETSPGAEPRWAGRREDGIGETIDPRKLNYMPIDAFNAIKQKEAEDVLQAKLPSWHPREASLTSSFACRTAGGEPLQVVVSHIRAGGTVSDLKELDCTLTWRTKDATEMPVVVRFSEEGFVQLDGIWKSKPVVNAREIRFLHAKTNTRIDRSNGKIIVTDDTTTVATGDCALASQVPRKF